MLKPIQRNFRVQLALVLMLVGTGLLIHGLLKWRELSDYSEKQIAAAVELNLSFDIARLGPDNVPPTEQIESMRKMIRTEVDAGLAQQRDVMSNWLAGGAALLVMAFGQMLVHRYLARPAASGPSR